MILFRIVVQRIRQAHGCIYRLIGYSNGVSYAPVESKDLEEILETLHSAKPDFGWDLFTDRKISTETAILFSENVELDETQLAVLGLKRSS